MTKIAFMSPHCLVDFTNGAAIATREGLKLLAAQGFQCMAFCGTRLDEVGEGLTQEQLFRRKINYEVRNVRLVAGGGQAGKTEGEKGRGGEGEKLGLKTENCKLKIENSQTIARTLSPDRPLPMGEGTMHPHPSPLPAGEGSGYDARLIFMAEGGVAVTMFENGSTRGGWFGPQEVKAFLAACEIFLTKNRPDIVITYGGDPVSIAVQRLVKRLGVSPGESKGTAPFIPPSPPAPLPEGEGRTGQSPVLVFWLRNFSYHNRAPFAGVDCIIVPSEFSRRYYREKLGLECNVLPSIVQWKGVGVERGTGPHPSPLPEGEGSGRYVTFINPEAAKGVYVFARIARELAARRPDIPLLVVQGRSGADALRNPALGLAEHIAGELHSQAGRPHHMAAQPAKAGTPARNINTMPFTPNPADFYPRTKLLLMPSLWNESFGLVAVEAMLNGIPVLASNRGALPETIGGRPHPLPVGEGTDRPHSNLFPVGEGTGGFLFDIPARYTPETRDVPTAEEVAPWVETIIRSWDDATEYDRASRAARERAQAWHPDRLAPLYRDFFSSIVRRGVCYTG